MIILAYKNFELYVYSLKFRLLKYTPFYYDSTKVGHMLFNKIVDYEISFETVKNADGKGIIIEFSLLLLNSSDVALDKKYMLICRKKYS